MATSRLWQQWRRHIHRTARTNLAFYSHSDSPGSSYTVCTRSCHKLLADQSLAIDMDTLAKSCCKACLLPNSGWPAHYDTHTVHCNWLCKKLASSMPGCVLYVLFLTRCSSATTSCRATHAFTPRYGVCLCMCALLYLNLLTYQVPLRSVSLSPEGAACNSKRHHLRQLQKLSGKVLSIMQAITRHPNDSRLIRTYLMPPMSWHDFG